MNESFFKNNLLVKFAHDPNYDDEIRNKNYLMFISHAQRVSTNVHLKTTTRQNWNF